MGKANPLRAFFALAIGAAASGLLTSPSATAKASFESGYTLEQTYNAALRLIRVDRGYKVTEKDPSAAYVLFEYKDTSDKPSQGAVELVPTGQSVRVVIQLPQMPRYHEQVLADALVKKLKDDFGEPPRKQPPPPSPPPEGGPSDAGTD